MTDVLAELKALLWEWDPIGARGFGGPSDEYDAYAPEIFILLRRGESIEGVKAYLDWLQCDWIGLPQSGEQTGENRTEGGRDIPPETGMLIAREEWKAEG